jgi:hypothetical protein
MTQKRCEFSQKFSRENSREEMRQHLRVIAGLSMEENRKAALRFVSMVLGLPYDRVSRIFYGQAHRIEAHEADRIRAYVQQGERLIARRAELNAQIREFRAQAPASLAGSAPASLPDMVMEPPPEKMKRRA